MKTPISAGTKKEIFENFMLYYYYCYTNSTVILLLYECGGIHASKVAVILMTLHWKSENYLTIPIVTILPRLNNCDSVTNDFVRKYSDLL